MAKTVVRENESLDDALRRFKRQVSRTGTLAEARKREFYVKPGLKRKLKKKIIKLQPIWLFFYAVFSLKKMLSFSILYMIKIKMFLIKKGRNYENSIKKWKCFLPK